MYSLLVLFFLVTHPSWHLAHTSLPRFFFLSSCHYFVTFNNAYLLIKMSFYQNGSLQSHSTLLGCCHFAPCCDFVSRFPSKPSSESCFQISESITCGTWCFSIFSISSFLLSYLPKLNSIDVIILLIFELFESKSVSKFLCCHLLDFLCD